MPDHDDLPFDDDTPPITRTAADETSQTRFGPRPVPEGHHRPSGPAESRRIPPHGDVAPDGLRAWPRPSRPAKWLVWGGAGLAAAALTVGAAYAARGLVDLLADDKRAPSPRSRDAAPAAPPKEPARKPRPPRATRRAPRQNLLQEVEANTASLTNGIENVMGAMAAALEGFRTIAGQASAIMQEFGDAAALVSSLTGRNPAEPHTPKPRRDSGPVPDLRDDPLTHDPMDGPEGKGPADHDPRLHRL